MIEAIRRAVPELLETYRDHPRFTETTVDLPGCRFTVPDVASFMGQLQAIFAHSAYEFTTDNANPVIYDCGANVGLSALYFSLSHPSARIVAYEPDPRLADYLDDNLACAGIPNVRVERKAVWTENGALAFYGDGADAGSLYGAGEGLETQAVRLADALAREERVDLLKLDVEGAEQAVFLDLVDVMDRLERVFMEYHSFSDRPQNLGAVLNQLEINGFRYFIEGMGTRARPFVDTRLDRAMDCQVDIWAHRT